MGEAEPPTSELEDSDDAPSQYDWARLDLSRAARSDVSRRLVGIVVALLVVFWRGQSVDAHAGDLSDEVGREMTVDLRVRLETQEVSGD